MKRGEVWRVQLPLGAGHAQAGERPAVIMQKEPYLSALPTILMVPFTSKLATSRFGGTLVVQPDAQNGLTAPSVALVFQLSAQDRRNFLYQMGELDAYTLGQIEGLIRQLAL